MHISRQDLEGVLHALGDISGRGQRWASSCHQALKDSGAELVSAVTCNRAAVCCSRNTR